MCTGSLADAESGDATVDEAAAGNTGLAVMIGAVAGGSDATTDTSCGSGSLPSVMLKWLGRIFRASRGTSMPIGSPGRNA